MSLTINGTTNTLTAASGLAIAGNTAVTGTLSATGNATFSGVTNAAQGVKFTTSYLGSASDYHIGNYLTNLVYNAPTGSGHNWAINNNDTMALNASGLTIANGKTLQVGSGSTTSAGLIAGYSGVSGFGALWSTGVTPSTSNYALASRGDSSVINGTTNSILAVNATPVLTATSTLNTSSNPLSVTDTTDSSSTTTGALRTAGGLGVAGSAYFGGRVNSALFRTTSGQVVCTATVQSGDLYTINRGAHFFDINCFATGAALQTTALISSDGTNHTLTILKSGASTVLAIVGNAIRVTCASNVTLDWNALRIA